MPLVVPHSATQMSSQFLPCVPALNSGSISGALSMPGNGEKKVEPTYLSPEVRQAFLATSFTPMVTPMPDHWILQPCWPMTNSQSFGAISGKAIFAPSLQSRAAAALSSGWLGTRESLIVLPPGRAAFQAAPAYPKFGVSE